MPAAAGQGALPAQRAAPEAAGVGAPTFLTLQEANDLIDHVTTMQQMEALLDQVSPPLSWYKTPEGDLTEEYMMETLGGFARAKEWVAIQLDSDVSAARVEEERRRRGARRRRTKRKHFRKRTSRKH